MGDTSEREILTRLRGLNLSWTRRKEVEEERVKGHVFDTLCRLRRIREAHFHGAELVFNLLEEGVLVVVVLLRI